MCIMRQSIHNCVSRDRIGKNIKPVGHITIAGYDYRFDLISGIYNGIERFSSRLVDGLEGKIIDDKQIDLY